MYYMEKMMLTNFDSAIEERALRQHGLLGRGASMGNALFAISYEQLPPEAKHILHLIITGGALPYPHKDGTSFGNRFGDLPSNGNYLEFTVPTPGVSNRGARRLVLRKNGMVFFTVCHYERVSGRMPKDEREIRTFQLPEDIRNGFYIVTGLAPMIRQQLKEAVNN
jgi:guanyl-specific ribonuclease Sa